MLLYERESLYTRHATNEIIDLTPFQFHNVKVKNTGTREMIHQYLNNEYKQSNNDRVRVVLIRLSTKLCDFIWSNANDITGASRRSVEFDAVAGRDRPG